MSQSEPAKLTEDFEWEESIRSFAASSDRARYVMFVVVVATFIAMFGWDTARDHGWMAQRAENARLALDNKLWEKKDCASLPEPQRTACHWLREKKLDEPTLRALTPKLDDLDLQHGYYLHLPILDVTFDVNDLGMATGLGFAFIMLTLFLSMVREHENLYLCLWRVKEKFRQADETPDDGWSRANLFYHSLAMAQVFSNPPTLGRWRRNVHDHLPSIIFFLPLLPQSFILYEDWKTRPIAEILNPQATKVSLATQVLCLAFNLALGTLCWLYSRSCEVKWRRCFAQLNPTFAKLPAASWWSWLELSNLRRGDPAPDGTLHDAGGGRSRLAERLMEEPGAGRTAILFAHQELPGWSAADLARLQAEHSCARGLVVVMQRSELVGDCRLGSRALLRKWRARELALAVVDGRGIIERLVWRADLVRASAVSRRAGPAAERAAAGG